MGLRCSTRVGSCLEGDLAVHIGYASTYFPSSTYKLLQDSTDWVSIDPIDSIHFITFIYNTRLIVVIVRISKHILCLRPWLSRSPDWRGLFGFAG